MNATRGQHAALRNAAQIVSDASWDDSATFRITRMSARHFRRAETANSFNRSRHAAPVDISQSRRRDRRECGVAADGDFPGTLRMLRTGFAAGNGRVSVRGQRQPIALELAVHRKYRRLDCKPGTGGRIRAQKWDEAEEEQSKRRRA